MLTSTRFTNNRGARNKEMFGEDADTWNPQRWFRESDEKKGPNLGVYGNL